ncbi:MAG: ABC transporter transmembrane domain-containing protein [Pseudomonadota bacterium]
MEKSLVRFVWKYGKVDTIKTLIVTFMTFPIIYLSLEIPKIIVNDALGAGNEPVQFPTEFLYMSLEQTDFLMVLCFLFITAIILNNWLKFVLNTQIGLTSERMMRRLRYTLYESVLRFPIRRFQHMKQGEIVQSVMGEIDALSGFFGEVISTPVWQGGMLAVYMTFIFLQDPFLGAAAIALYPVQAYVIPKLQKRVVMLNKERVANVRKIADNIGESVGAIEEIHTSDTARWHLAQISDRLFESYRIRLAIFKRKYLIKGLNNFLIALTPFAFYLFGGLQVINGNLELGSLVAVLAAYKDVAGPWKALLNYFQRFSDLNSRFELVIESFTGDDVYARERIYGADGDATRLTGDIVLKSATYGTGGSGLASASCTAPASKFTALVGGDEGGREIMMKMMGGLIVPDSGRVTMGGTDISECTLPVIGRSIAYVASENAYFAGTLRQNLTYSLRKHDAMLTEGEIDDAAEKRAEAVQTGNIAANPLGDWTDYKAADVEDHTALNKRLVELTEAVGLSEELYHLGLQARMDPEAHPDLANRILASRSQLRESALNNRELSDLVEFWEEGALNQNASLLENVLFAMPQKATDTIADLAEDKRVMAALNDVGATPVMIRAGLSIAEQLVELLGAVDEDSSLLDSFADYSKKDILASAEIVEAARLKSDYQPKDDARRILISFALAFVPVRDRLDVVDEVMEADILAARARAITLLGDDEYFVSFGEDRYSPALSLSENLLDGKRRFDRRSAWRKFDEFLEEAISKGGLRDGITEVGLSSPLGAGGSGLSASSRKRGALVRALLKRPEVLIVDGVGAGSTPDDQLIRDAIRAEMQGRAVIMAVSDMDAAKTSDHVIQIKPDGVVREGSPSVVLEDS